MKKHKINNCNYKDIILCAILRGTNVRFHKFKAPTPWAPQGSVMGAIHFSR